MVEIVAERYAKALFDAAVDANCLEQAVKDVETVRETVASNPDLMRFLLLPNITREQKIDALQKIFNGVLGEPVLGFLHVLVRADRVDSLIPIFDDFDKKVMEHDRTVRALVTSAEPLKESELAQIRKTLEKAADKKIILETRIDPSLIGGLVVRVNDLIYDNSIKSQLAKMTRHLRGLRMSDKVV